MRLLSLTFIALIIGCKATNKVPNNYDSTPVLIHLASEKQIDSIGFNLVSEIPKLLYPRLLTGDLPIWENSKKDFRINKERFLALEQTARLPFVNSEDLFIHEFWRMYKRNFDFAVAGFSFIGKTKSGREVNYGFIDAKDVVDLLQTNNIPTNANGPATLSYWDALHTMDFRFNLVQFGNENFKEDAMQSVRLQYQAIEDPSFYREFTDFVIDKEIEYEIVKPGITSNASNKVLFEAFTKVINNNKQTILNAGGAEHFSHLIGVPWKINSILVTENWSKYKNIPLQELKAMQFFIEGRPIILSKEQLDELGFQINLQGVEEILSEKSFDFVLQRINSQELRAADSEKYYNALLTNSWSKLN